MDVTNWRVWAGGGGGLLALVLVFFIGRASAPDAAPTAPGDGGEAAAPAKETIWTCSMHPQIRMPKPGKCPICGMDLIPADSGGGGGGGPRSLVMTPNAKALAEVAEARVERRFAGKTIRMVGKIDYDETRVRTIAAWVDGRIDRLYVDYTGTPVRPGDHLVKLYSPALLTAQEELLEAKRRVDASTGEASAFLRASNVRALDSARDKLRLWGLTAAQIAAIETSGELTDHVEIRAPQGGVVIHKGVHEGMYVKTGAVMYRIADLSKLWVQLEAYESDLSWLRYGQDVAVETEAYPGEVFAGRVSFLAPEVDPKTRTVKVRVNVDNADGRLRPGMFVHGQVVARVAHGGRVMEPALSGKWICPMHPAVIKDGQEPCPICGMDLVKAEDLGYVPVTEQADARPIVVPATAVLRTGRRAIVYVREPNTTDPTYEAREIVLGPRADDVYLVRDGLKEGEIVVVHGAFKIDSSLQILAKPSMMGMPPSPVRSRPGGSDAVREALAPVFDAYLAIQAGLAADDFDAAAAAFKQLQAAAAAVPMAVFTGRAHGAWMELAGVLRAAARTGAGAVDIAAARIAFRDATAAVIGLEEAFGHGGATTYVRAHCPMAFDDTGASWLQTGDDIRNPYFGSQMYRCGTIGEHCPSHQRRAAGPRTPTPPVTPGSGPEPRPKAPAPKVPATPKRRHVLQPVWDGYLSAQAALAADDLAAAKSGLVALGAASAAVKHPDLPDDAHGAWSVAAAEFAEVAKIAAGVSDIEVLRRIFHRTSKAALAMLAAAPSTASGPLSQAFCPMAFGNTGAKWLQRGDTIANPYFGARMLRCGSVEQRFAAGGGK